MTWIRELRGSPKGRFLNFVFDRFGQRLFGKYGSEMVGNLKQFDG